MPHPLESSSPPSASSLPSAQDLAERLLLKAELGRADSYYRLARMVARVLTGQHLKQRRKWCDLAHQLAATPGVDARLIHQAIQWLESPTLVSQDVSS